MLIRSVVEHLSLRRGLVSTLFGLLLLLAIGLSPHGSYAADVELQVGGAGKNAQGGPERHEPNVPEVLACGPDWTLGNSRNHITTFNTIQSMSALSPTDVWAVGSYFDMTIGSARNLIMRWNGSEWTRLPSPNEGTSTNQLHGVVAVSAVDAWAVGYYYDTAAAKRRVLILRWNGVNWARHVVTSPSSGNNYLNGIAMYSATDIWAVGVYHNAGGLEQTLAMHWDGAGWTPQFPTNPAGATRDHELRSVSIVPGSMGAELWAAGHYFDGTMNRTLVLRRTTMGWGQVVSPNPSTDDNYLWGVSALSSNEVWFSGYIRSGFSDNLPITMRWNGSTFTTPETPGLGAFTRLHHIAALSSNDVWAVGSYIEGTSANRTYVLHWTGSNWNVVPSANPGVDQTLLALAALDANNIWAGNTHQPEGSPGDHTLIERYNGTGFVHVESPNGPNEPNVLRGVAARSTNDVWAVGGHATGGSSSSTLVQHWDGDKWEIVQSANLGTTNVLEDVVALSATEAWAVGTYRNASGIDRTLIEKYNGTEWVVVTSPNIGANDNQLFSIDMASLTDGWAVGTYNNGTDGRTLALHWDGTAWTPVTSPNIGSEVDNILESVSVVPGTMGQQAWAVGNTSGDFVINTDPIILGWNGSAWQLVPPADYPPDMDLNDVSVHDVDARAHNDVWVVGEWFTGGRNVPLVLHFDGEAWSRWDTPTQGAEHNSLDSVVALAPNDVWAAGSYVQGPGVSRALLMHFDGSAWSIVPAPSPGIVDSIRDLTAVSSYNVWGVGQTRSSDTTLFNTQTLVVQLNKCPCTTQFNDAPSDSPFYENIRCLACRDIFSGYACGAPGEPCPGNYFRPNANVTRGQAAKIIANAAGYTDAIPPSRQTFQDVPPGSPFWLFVERVYEHGAIGGYPCGAPGEPCPGNYFRPGNNLTRGQLAKIATEVADYDETPSGQSFQDVPTDSPFYAYIERARLHDVISGYGCGGPGEPCPGAYFRPGNNVTRGQTAKIVSNTFYPGCVTP